MSFIIRNLKHSNYLLTLKSNKRNVNRTIVSLETKEKALKLQEIALDEENCILVDSNDKKTGYSSKRDCHKVVGKTIKLHRAFSVFLFNKDGDMLIQKRSNHKVIVNNKIIKTF